VHRDVASSQPATNFSNREFRKIYCAATSSAAIFHALFPNSAAMPIASAFVKLIWVGRKSILTAVGRNPDDLFPSLAIEALSILLPQVLTAFDRFARIRSKVSTRLESIGESFHQAQFPIIESRILRVNPQLKHRNCVTGHPRAFSMRFHRALILFSYSSFHLYYPTLTIQHTHSPRIRPDENRDKE
jgi:hypothetical protein